MRKNKLLLTFFGIFLIFASCSQKDTSDPRVTGPAVSINKVWAKDFAPGQLEAHFLKHKTEFGDITQEEYLANAKILLNSALGSDILEKYRDNGDILHYRISTGEFAVMTSAGRIRTYFKADYRYWQKQ
ncbi:MAG: hypothetical protein ABIA97_01955 [Candidatus Omnitrophota bacterium]